LPAALAAGTGLSNRRAAQRVAHERPSAFPDQQKPVPPYKHTPLFPLGADTTPYKKVTSEGVRVEKVLGKDMLVVSREALRRSRRPRSARSTTICARGI